MVHSTGAILLSIEGIILHFPLLVVALVREEVGHDEGTDSDEVRVAEVRAEAAVVEAVVADANRRRTLYRMVLCLRLFFLSSPTTSAMSAK